MRTLSLTLVAAAAVSAASLHAQSASADTASGSSSVYIPPPPAQQAPAEQAPAPLPAPPPAPGPYYGYAPYAPARSGATTLAGSIDFPYAFNWDALGVSGELGGIVAGHNFLGVEASYYGGDDRTYDVFNGPTYIGHFRSAQDVTTVEFAYRYYQPLWYYGPHAPVTFYIGGGAGGGWVSYTNSGGYFGFRNDNNANFAGEVLTGFEFNTGPVALRLGYRYVDVTNAWEFNRRLDVDSSAFEAGVSLKF